MIADRYPKKPLVLAGQIFPTLLIVITGILIVTGAITVWMLFLSTLLMGFGFALMGPARQAWLGELVPRRLLANGVALQQMSQNMARVFGPMLVAVLLAAFAFSTGYLYLIVASFFLIVIPLTTMLPKTRPTRREGEPPRVLAEMRQGFAYLLKTPRLRVLWVFWMVMVVCGFAFNTLMPGYVEREFDRPSTDAFNVYLIFGAASFLFNIPLAGLVGGRWGWPLLLITGFGSAVSFFLIAGAPSFGGVLLMSILNGASTSGVMLVTMSLMMAHSRPEYFGRVMSFITLGYGAQSIMAGVWGGVADALGGRQTFVVIGIIALAITAFMVIAWLRTRHLPIEFGTAAGRDQRFGPANLQSARATAAGTGLCRPGGARRADGRAEAAKRIRPQRSRDRGRLMRNTLAAFAHGNFRLLWGGTLFGTTAFMTSFLLVPIVAYEITGSYTASGVAQMGSGVSMLLLGPIGGVIADRYAKKPLALVSQIVPGLIILGTGILVVTDQMTIWMLFLSSLLMGIGFALMGPARQAWLGELVFEAAVE